MERRVSSGGWVCYSPEGSNVRPSRIKQWTLPSIPPLSPPPTATVFPDEPQQTEEPSIPDVIASSEPTLGSLFNDEETQTPSSPTPPPITTSMADIMTRQRGFSPPPPYAVSEWIPANCYSPAMIPKTPPLSASTFFPFETDYTSTLPPLPPIPLQASKRRKTMKDEKRKDMSQLKFEYELNPLHGALSKSTKCLSTEDWKIGMQEIRHIRAMDRIEKKKETNRWSLRQPKKLRGPSIPKAHWDYLLEEMVSRFGFISDFRNG